MPQTSWFLATMFPKAHDNWQAYWRLLEESGLGGAFTKDPIRGLGMAYVARRGKIVFRLQWTMELTGILFICLLEEPRRERTISCRFPFYSVFAGAERWHYEDSARTEDCLQEARLAMGILEWLQAWHGVDSMNDHTKTFVYFQSMVQDFRTRLAVRIA
jgi:hypothetical protein